MMSLERPKILVVDDNPQNLQVVGNILYENGYEPIATLSGTHALKLLRKVTPKLILLDVMMPEMDGFDTCRHIRNNKSNKNIPIIFLTAKVENEDVLKGFELGAVDYVRKPFSSLELLARINVHLELKEARETNKILSGLLPICASCKKIRDDKGHWHHLETYIATHSEAEFTHSICMECTRELYPGLKHNKSE